MSRRLAPLLLIGCLLPLAGLPVARPALAQPAPPCTAASAGTVACLSGRLCECRYQRGGSITGVPSGHRWDCSLLRPDCGEALAPPGVAPPPALPYPPQILLDPYPRPSPHGGGPGR